MKPPLNRREFLQLSGLAIGSLVIIPFDPRQPEQDYGELGRITVYEVNVYGEPNLESEIVGKRYRDQLVHLYYELTPPDGPAYNPLWYRVWGGYLHSAYVQRVKIKFNKPINNIRPEGHLAEVTVPYTQAYRFTRYNGWLKEYRLYHETNHWVKGLDEGPDGDAWYRLTDELLRVDYHVPAAHLRLIPDEEISPISTEVPPEKKRIEISLATQSLKAFENDAAVYFARVSTGIPRSTPTSNNVSTETPKGRYRIESKMPSKHMGNGNLMQGNFDIAAYELVGVPWTSFFIMETGVALHGTYWHNNFGWPMSRGCVNMRNGDAKWIFRWTTPTSAPTDIERRGYGTLVVVS